MDEALPRLLPPEEEPEAGELMPYAYPTFNLASKDALHNLDLS
jgi:hypothetical protein